MIRFVWGACATALLMGSALAGQPQRWSPRQVVAPALLVDQEPTLCASLLRDAQAAFDSSDPRHDWAEDEKEEMHWLDWGPPLFGLEQGTAVHLLEVDLEGDGQKQGLLYVSQDLGMRVEYTGYILLPPTLALIKQEPQRLEKLYEAKRNGRESDDWLRGLTPYYPYGDESRRHPLHLGGRNGFYKNRPFRWHEHYYVREQSHDAEALNAAVFRLRGDGERQLVCHIETRGVEESLANLKRRPEIASAISVLGHIGYAGTGDCGTLRSNYRNDDAANRATLRAAIRPWAVSRSDGSLYFTYSPEMWAFLEDWSRQDPWNRREYLTLLQHIAPAERAYADYLREAFGLAPTAARIKAGEVFEQFIAAWFLISEGGATQFGGAFDPLDVSDDVDHGNAFGKTPLMVAAHLNRIDQVRALLKQGANPNARTRTPDDRCDYTIARVLRTPLMYAAENASPLVMKVLLDAGADPEARDIDEDGMQFYLKRNPRLTTEQQAMDIRALAASGAGLADRPGFDCQRVSRRLERTICGSEALRLLDYEMTETYKRALPLLGTWLKAEQTRWIKLRAEECSPSKTPDYEVCIAYRTAARERYMQNLQGELTTGH